MSYRRLAALASPLGEHSPIRRGSKQANSNTPKPINRNPQAAPLSQMRSCFGAAALLLEAAAVAGAPAARRLALVDDATCKVTDNGETFDLNTLARVFQVTGMEGERLRPSPAPGCF